MRTAPKNNADNFHDSGKIRQAQNNDDRPNNAFHAQSRNYSCQQRDNDRRDAPNSALTNGPGRCNCSSAGFIFDRLCDNIVVCISATVNLNIVILAHSAVVELSVNDDLVAGISKGIQ